MKIQRNDLCACGSGKKYKHCCLKDNPSTSRLSTPTTAELGQLDSLFSAGLHVELESAAQGLIVRYPDAGVIWKLLGISLHMQGKSAMPAFRKAAELLPNDAEVHANLAVMLRAAGEFQAAVDSGLHALRIKPNLAEAHNNVGVALHGLGKLNDAVASYDCAIKLKPNFLEAYLNLGSALKDLGLFDKAIEIYEHAIEIKPDYVKAHNGLAIAQWYLGAFGDAEKSYSNALKLDPSCEEALLGLSQICIERGELETAENILLSTLQINSNNLEARFSLVKTSKIKVGNENMAALIAAESLMQENNLLLTPQRAINLHFTLGKCFDDCGDYAKAFHHFSQGNKLKRATFTYSMVEDAQHFNDIIRVFNKETIARLNGHGDPSKSPIFVLGMPRSGTTLVEQIISSHPDVYGAGEVQDLLNIAERDVVGNGVTYPNNIPYVDTRTIAEWSSEYLTRMQKRDPNALRITNKMPANFFAIGLIHLMLPNAKIIHVNRSPLDTCLSCFTQLFDVGQYHTYDLTELGQYFVDYARLMSHWRTVLPEQAFLDVHYESIVADQEKQARRIIDYCNLTWDDACLNSHKNNRFVQTASLVQVRQPIYKSSVERWRHYEKFLGPLLVVLDNMSSSLSREFAQ